MDSLPNPQSSRVSQVRTVDTFWTVHMMLTYGIFQTLAENKKGQGAGAAEGPGGEQGDLTEAKR